MSKPEVIIVGSGYDVGVLERLSISISRSELGVIFEDVLTNFTPEQLNFMIRRSNCVDVPKPSHRETESDKRRMQNHSYKAVKERNKFFMK